MASLGEGISQVGEVFRSFRRSFRDFCTSDWKLPEGLSYRMQIGDRIVNPSDRLANPFDPKEQVIDATIDILMKKGPYTLIIGGDKQLSIKSKRRGQIETHYDDEQYVFQSEDQTDSTFYTLYNPHII